jgi:CheY-like chemotaxis protein
MAEGRMVESDRVVLLVEDEPDTRDSLKALIESEGYVVATAIDGREAIEFMSDAPPPGLVVLDLLLPAMTGWEFLVEMRKVERLSQIPVIVISGVDDELMPHAPAISERIRKPIDFDRFFMLLEKYLPAR